MIFVDRNRVPTPEILTSPRILSVQEKTNSLLQKPSSHLGQLRLSFDSSAINQTRAALTKLFHGKCAYCESPSTGGAFLHDIEHFRPKRLSQKDGLELTHYAWLAYTWENLLIACTSCNRPRKNGDRIVGKGGNFPVLGERAPVMATLEQCRKIEQGTLLDPCFDQPNKHLSFAMDGFCHPLTERGNLTISLLNLNRTELQTERSNIYKKVTALSSRLTSKSNKNTLISNFRKSELKELLSPWSAYAGAARSYFEQHIANSKDINIRPLYFSDKVDIALIDHVEIITTTNTFTIPRYRIEDTLEIPSHFRNKQKLPTHAYSRLTRVVIQNFKSLEHIHIEIPESPSGQDNCASALMLLGENATGKSSILEAVSLALLGTDNIRRLGIDGKKYLRRDANWLPLGKPAQIKLYFDNREAPSTSLTIDPITGEFNGETQQQTVILGYGPRRYFDSKHKKKRAPYAAARVKTMFDPLVVLANPESWLLNASERDYRAAIRALRQLMLLPEESFISRPPRGQRKNQELILELEGNNSPLQHLSEGYRTVMVTAVDMMREFLTFWPNLEDARGIVLIDELETHLHPRWKMRIMSRLREAMPNVQFICTTHDPLCLRGLYDGEVQVLRRIEGVGVEQVTDLPSVQGLTVEQLLTSDYFGLLSTEDPDVEQQLIRYAELTNKQKRSADEEEELSTHRAKFKKSMTIGQTPQSQLIYETANELLIKNQNIPTSDRVEARQQLANKMLDLWKSLDREKRS